MQSAFGELSWFCRSLFQLTDTGLTDKLRHSFVEIHGHFFVFKLGHLGLECLLEVLDPIQQALIGANQLGDGLTRRVRQRGLTLS